MDFFRDHYLGNGSEDPDAWRRIQGEWMAGAGEFALQLDSDTNNTSLALAFELPDGRVLLFPGDAQVGNWESWHADADGKPPSGRLPAATSRPRRCSTTPFSTRSATMAATTPRCAKKGSK